MKHLLTPMQDKQISRLAEDISNGHAYPEHIVYSKQNEFEGLNINSPKDFAKHIETVLKSEDTLAMSAHSGRFIYYHEKTNTIVIENPNSDDKGTCFESSTGKEKIDSYFIAEALTAQSRDIAPPEMRKGGYTAFSPDERQKITIENSETRLKIRGDGKKLFSELVKEQSDKSRGGKGGGGIGMCILWLLPALVMTMAYFLYTPTAAAQTKGLVSWDSPEGIIRLSRSNYKIDFFSLANNFEPQENKLFCGVASSVIVLNALRLNKDIIKKPIEDSVLNQEDKMYFKKGMNPFFERYTQNNVWIDDKPKEVRGKTKIQVLGQPMFVKEGDSRKDFGFQLHQLAKFLRGHGLRAHMRVADNTLDKHTIHSELLHNLKTKGDYIVVNYQRKTLGQKGGGHISPLAAWDQKSDSFLIMDVNPNRAGWVWVPASMLIGAMQTFDTISNRGYLLVREHQPPFTQNTPRIKEPSSNVLIIQ